MPGPKPPTTSSSRSSTDLPLTYRWLLHPELASSHPVRTTSGAKTQANLGIFVNEQATLLRLLFEIQWIIKH
jgi:hypothetical protein